VYCPRQCEILIPTLQMVRSGPSQINPQHDGHGNHDLLADVPI
jgi:hypothetical protein